MSQDDWVDKIMIPTMQSTSGVASLFFINIIVTLVFLVINLFVAVISTSFMSFHTSDTANHDSIKSGSRSSAPSLFDLRKMDKEKEEQHVMLVYGTTIAVENAARRGTVLDNDLDTLEATPVRPTEDSPRLKSAANTSEVLSGKSSRDLLPITTAVKLMENHMIQETPTDSAEDKFLTDLKNAPGRLGRLRRYVMSNHFSDMMVLCISLNTIVLMVEYPSMPLKAQYAVNFIEATFTFVFTFELMLRLYAYQSIRNYFSAKDRCFDAFVVVVSLVYTIFNPPHVRAVGEHKSSLGWLDNVSILRTLRIGRLMWKWNGTRKLIEAILKSGKSMKHLIIFLMHFLIVHTLLAMQLFQDIHFEEPTASTFDEFFVAFITMFQVFSGDRWAEVMQSILITLPFGGQVFVAAFFMVFFFFGQFVILNLFIAVILDNFAISEEEAYQLQLERVLAQPKELLMLEKFDEVGVRAFYQNRDMMNLENVQDIKARRFLGVSERGLDTTHSGAAHEITSLDVAKHWIGVLLQTTGFKLFIILTIFASCVALALDDPIVDHHDPIETQHHEDMSKVLDGVNYFAMTVFITEFFLKIFAHGFGLPILGEKLFKIGKYIKLNRIRRRRKLAKYYIEDPWNLLDFFLLLVSILDLTVTQKYPNLSFAKVLRVGRVLRPLRLFNQDGDMKLIMTSFAASLPAVGDVLVFCLGVFVIFGIAGRTLYSEKMYQCNDTSVKNRTMCQGFYIAYPIPESPVGILATRAWVPYRATFDNLMTSMMVLMEISSLKWIYTAHFAMSIVGQDEQPETNASIANASYFILLVFLGNFFLIRLFVGVLVEQFQRHNGTQILTSSQKCWVELERHMLLLKPKHSPPQPSNKYRNMAYKFVKSMRFEHGMTVLVLSNMIFLLVNGKHLDESTKHTLTSIDTFFLTIYSIESLLKIIAYGRHCVRDSWFLFELAILIGSYISNVSDESPTKGIGKPVTQIGRIFRVMRVMKFAKLSKGVRTVFRTFRASLGSIGNVVLLLILLLYIFSILGRQLFGTTKLGEYLNDDLNFRTFSSSFLLLFGIMAGGDWNFVMTDCMISTGFCSTMVDDIGNTITDCGNFHAAWIFFFVFIVSIVYIFLNLFIAVILENFRSCYVKDISPVTLEDFEGYQDIFEKFDRHHKGTIPLHQLAAFLQELPPNLRVGSTGNRIAYLHLRYEIENLLMTNKSIPFFNGLLRSICIHHMGIRALSYEQQRDRVKQIFLIKQRVANMLVTAMITGAVQRKRIRDKKRTMGCTAQARADSKNSHYQYEPHPKLMAQTPTSSLASSPAKKSTLVSKRVSMVQEEMENLTSTSHDHQAEAENNSCLQPPPEIAPVGNKVANAENDESTESKSHEKKGHKKHKHHRKDKSSHHNHDSIELPMPSTPCTNEADVPLDVPTDQVLKNVDDWRGMPRRLPKLGDAPKIVPL
ncbi:hypothetical protein LEN26_010739 [Aphanomyces euteiches]|nr:hypothetical protein LEN26_010739 [Aphanomyces euteiches]